MLYDKWKRNLPPGSPAEVLFNDYIVPSGMTLGQYADFLKVQRNQLCYIFSGRKFSFWFIERLSRVTNTPSRYWHHLQINYLFSRFLRKRVNKIVIQPIVVPKTTLNGKLFEAPWIVLQREYIKPLRIDTGRLAKQCKMSKKALQTFLLGKSKLNYPMAGRLGAALGTGTKYWLDIQLGYEIQEYLLIEGKNIEQIRNSLSNFYERAVLLPRYSSLSQKSYCFHPGQVLLEDFIKPSGIPSRHWAPLFMLPEHRIRSFLAGKKEISPELVIKFSKVFKTKVEFWIDLNNNYYANKAHKESLKPEKRIKTIHATNAPNVMLLPAIKILENNFLGPMNCTRSVFANHIKVILGRVCLTPLGLNRISFELAVRMGEALKMDPRYWLWLQLEYDIQRYETNIVHNGSLQATYESRNK